jgi:hypothetical protein
VPINPITFPSIGSGPVQIVPSLSGQVNVYNGDLVNVLLVSPSQNPALTNAVPIQPLTNASIDGNQAQWAIALTGSCANVTVGNALQMSPSPAQVAAQIIAAGLAAQIAAAIATGNPLGTPGGVPLLGQPVQLYNYSIASIAANAHNVPILNAPAGQQVINMSNYLSYDLDAIVLCNAAETSPFALWVFNWCLDAGGSNIAYTEVWGAAATVAGLEMTGNGPVRAQYLSISLSIPGSTFPMQLSQFMLTATSRPFVGDNPDFRTNSSQPPGYAAPGLGANVGDNILGGITGAVNNIPANASANYVCGLFCGGINVNIQAVGLANVTYTPSIWLPGVGFIPISGSGAITNNASFAYTQVVRYPFIARFTSTNGAAQTLNFNVIASSRG